MIAKDLSKNKRSNVVDPKAMQQIKSTGTLDRAANTTIFSLLKNRKKIFSIFHKEL